MKLSSTFLVSGSFLFITIDYFFGLYRRGYLRPAAMSSIMQNNWFCKSPEKFKRIAAGIYDDFKVAYPPAESWKLGPCHRHIFFSKLDSKSEFHNPTDFSVNHVK